MDLDQLTVGTLTSLTEDENGPLLVTCYFDLGLGGDPEGFMRLQQSLRVSGVSVHVVMLVDPRDLFLDPGRAVLRGLRRQPSGRPLLEHLRGIPGAPGHTYRRDQPHTGGSLPHAHVFDRKLREIGAFNSDGTGHDHWKGSKTVLPAKVFQGLGQDLPSHWKLPPGGVIEHLTADRLADSHLLLG